MKYDFKKIEKKWFCFAKASQNSPLASQNHFFEAKRVNCLAKKNGRIYSISNYCLYE
jgi:hypothetical protein